jgi:aspartyl-tRNA(Asn)/glutamyl-tRNA(Gln) amidotransferase subunit C
VAVTNDDVRHIAMLARLGVDDARMPALVRELNGILEHMKVLETVAASETATATDTGAGMPLRADLGPPVALGTPRESFAPSMRDGFFLVPRLATHEDDVEEAS